jgi:hypothetical protein
MTKTQNQIIIVFLHQNQNIFLEKKTYPPPSFKLNGRSLTRYIVPNIGIIKVNIIMHHHAKQKYLV